MHSLENIDPYPKSWRLPSFLNHSCLISSAGQTEQPYCSIFCLLVICLSLDLCCGTINGLQAHFLRKYNFILNNIWQFCASSDFNFRHLKIATFKLSYFRKKIFYQCVSVQHVVFTDHQKVKQIVPLPVSLCIFFFCRS